jgi:hypothetical protein
MSTSSSDIHHEEISHSREQLLGANALEKIEALDKLYALATSLKGRQYAQQISQIITLPLLFQQLDTQYEKVLESAVRATQKILQVLPVETVVSMLTDPDTAPSMTALMSAGSKHGYTIVRLLVLEQLEKLNVKQVFENEIYLNIVTTGLVDDELSVVKHTTQIILSWVRQDEENALQNMFKQSSPFLATLNQLLTGNDIIRLRVFELITEISRVSETAFTAIATTGILQALAKDLNAARNDILQLLNILEIIKNLCTSKPAIDWLYKNEVFTTIVQILVENEEDELVSSFIFHLIADVSAAGHKVLSEDFLASDNDVIYKRLFSSLQSDDVTKQNSALVVIGNLCSQSGAALRKFLLESSERRTYYLSLIIDAKQQDVLITFLHSLAQIVESDTVHNQVQPLIQELETQIVPRYSRPNVTSNYLINSLFDQIRTDPFPDIRFAVFHVFRSLAYHTWGIDDYLLAYPTFIDWLVNRNTEIIKEGKDWKYGIAEIFWQTLKNNKGSCGTNLSSQNYVKVRVYLQRGPYLEDVVATVTLAAKSA